MKSLKLNSLESSNLSNKEMLLIKGGDSYETRYCNCGCKYADQPGGSSYDANGFANAKANKDTVIGGETTHTVIVVIRDGIND